MPRKKSYLTITDQFCGAGGSSQGASMAGIKGMEIRLALNHWKLAIETHQTNFPNAMHDCTDISAADPRRYPSTDILITSPECTNHSLAKGKKTVKAQLELYQKGILDPAAERSRATMWDVPRFAEYHNYNIIIVENVVDARKWVMYDAWLLAMHALGYNHRAIYLNSMHAHPTPQSRDRMYVVFWKKGNRAPNLDFTPLAPCHKCGNDVEAVQTWKRSDVRYGKYKQQYIYCCPRCATHIEPYYYAAFNCIDWSNTGQRIGDRKKPLSPNTITRIEYGLKKYGQQPMLIKNYGGGFNPQLAGIPLHKPTGTLTTSDHHALLSSFTVATRYTSGVDCRVKSTGEALGTQPGDVSHGIAMPFIVLNEHSKTSPQVRMAADTFQTHATQQRMGVVTPYIIKMNRTGKCQPATDVPCDTLTAGGINHAFLLNYNHDNKANSLTEGMPALTTQQRMGLITHDAMNSFLAYNYNGTQTSHVTEATDAVTTKERISLITHLDPKIEDCHYRMLRSGEVGRAMAFDESYIVCGSEKDKVKQYGNAVTPPAMRDIVKRCVESL